jgi:predicted  nucleic acid-binding Zn-ribbon protein
MEEYECKKLETIEFLKNKISEIEIDFKAFKEKFGDLREQFLLSSQKMNDMFEILKKIEKEIDEKNKEPGKLNKEIVKTIIILIVGALTTLAIKTVFEGA